MRAFAVPAAGASPQVTEVPDPTPGPGEVLVRVAASSVNGFDLAVSAGYLQGMMEHRYPLVLGKDFAGTVAEVGPGVTRFEAGDPVFGVVTKPYLGDGGLGQLLVVGEQHGIARIPDGVDPAVAGALGLAGSAALDSVSAADLGPGRTVLISGATGGVGALAVQYARAAGARVFATAPATEEQFVRDLGAEEAIDFRADLAGQVRALAPGGVDVVIHLAGDAAALGELLAPGGLLVSTLGVGPDKHPGAVAVMADPATSTLERLGADVASGAVRVPISATYDLADAGRAFADFGGGTLGKLAISIRPGLPSPTPPE